MIKIGVGFIIFFSVFGFAASDAGQVGFLTELEIKKFEDKIDYLDELIKARQSKVNKKNNIDSFRVIFVKIADGVRQRYIQKFNKSKKVGKGFQVTHSERLLFIKIIEAAENFSKHVDLGLIHFYELSLLYKSAKWEMNLAIDRSSLKPLEKTRMKEAIKNILSLN